MAPKVELRRHAPLADLVFILSNLRPLDRLEVAATSFSEDPMRQAKFLQHMGDFQWTAYWGDTPVATVGAIDRWPGCWNMWCVATEDMPRVVLSVTRHMMRTMLPAMTELGMRRCDSQALADYETTHRWLEFMGARRESTLENWGKNGETFVSYVWLRDLRHQDTGAGQPVREGFPHG